MIRSCLHFRKITWLLWKNQGRGLGGFQVRDDGGLGCRKDDREKWTHLGPVSIWRSCHRDLAGCLWEQKEREGPVRESFSSVRVTPELGATCQRMWVPCRRVRVLVSLSPYCGPGNIVQAGEQDVRGGSRCREGRPDLVI